MMKYAIIFPTMLVFCIAGFVVPGKNKKPTGHYKVTLHVEYDSTGIKAGGDTIAYSKFKKINWKDFTGRIPENFPAAANSAVGFMYRASMVTDGRNTNLSLRISCFFVKSQSWVREKDKSGYILEHERHHFNIARHGAELFRSKLLATTFKENQIGEQINNTYREAWREYENLQNQYDEETDHSINSARQKEWSEKVNGWMSKLP
jgi:hypothetical protein